MNAIDPLRAKYQAVGTNQCGQACVATLLDLDLDEAVDLVGKSGCTNARDIREALAKRGIVVGARLHPKCQEPETLYLARVRWPKTAGDTRKTPRTHWVLIDLDRDATVFDPGWGFNPQHCGGWPIGSRVTSIYPIDTGGRR